MEQLGYVQAPHCTRYTSISMLTEAHVDQTMLKAIVGLSGVMTLTERAYTHLDIETLVGQSTRSKRRLSEQKSWCWLHTIASPHIGIELSTLFCGESLLYISAILPSVGITFNSSFVPQEGQIACFMTFSSKHTVSRKM